MTFDTSHIVEDWRHLEDPCKYLFIGAGKCGSTLMIKLLTLLGLNTGYKTELIDKAYENAYEWPCRGEKLEYYLNITQGKFPTIIKNNKLSEDLPDLINRFGWYRPHVFILNRNTESTVKRFFYDRYGDDWEEKTDPRKISVRRQTVMKRKSSLLDHVSELGLKTTIMNYPRFATDPAYCYLKLRDLIYYIDFARFEKVHANIVDRNQLRGW